MRRSCAKSKAIRLIPWLPALALARVVATRRKSDAGPLTFGMTFPFSTHNYQLRFWMAAAGVDPEEDVRLVVLPPPYMVDSLANGQVDAFCVGEPWNSVAVDLGIGHILNFVSDILPRAVEKVLAVRQSWADRNPQVLAALVRAAVHAADFIERPENRAEVAVILAHPKRVGVPAEAIQRALAGRLKIICWWVATAPRGPILRRRRGFTLKWCAGAGFTQPRGA